MRIDAGCSGKQTLITVYHVGVAKRCGKPDPLTFGVAYREGSTHIQIGVRDLFVFFFIPDVVVRRTEGALGRESAGCVSEQFDDGKT